MKTPYDPAIRVQRREIDSLGVAINVQVSILNRIEDAREEIGASAAREADVAQRNPGISAHAYMEHIRAEQRRLASDGIVQRARLDQMRSKAAEAYGAFRTIETAAEEWRADAERSRAKMEQARLDDNAAMAFLKARNAIREARGR